MSKNPKRSSSLHLIADFMRGSKRWFAASILFTLLMTLIEMLTPRIIAVTVDSVIGDKPFDLPEAVVRWIRTVGGAEALRAHLIYIAAAVVALALLGALCRYIFNICNTKGAETLVETMRNDLYRHIGRLPYAWHMQNKTGDIIQRCTSDVDLIKRFLSDQLTSVVHTVILLAASLFFMLGMNVKLGLIAAASFPVIIAYSAFFHKRIGARFRECDENEGALSAIAQENLTGVRVVRAFGRESFEKQRFEAQNHKYTNCWMKLCKLLSLFWSAGDLISGLQVMLIIVFGSVFCVRGSMTSGELIAFISYNSMLIWPVRRLGRMIAEMSKAGVSIKRIRYIMGAEEEGDKPHTLTPDMTGDICFEHVTFGYEAGKDVLKDLSVTFKGGTTVGVLGGTGSGKSTLVHLLKRFFTLSPEQGRITVGGVDIADMDRGWVRTHVAAALQEPYLFSRTVRENITIAGDGQSEEELRAATRIACLEKTVEGLSQGYETVVGERGVTLSGGQKQRMAMAQMLMQKAPIMIFDDSLSAVDTQTDAMIRAQLKNATENATVIIISHRITTLMQTDKILVLDDGKAAQYGTHEELLAADGLYKRIYDIQMMPEEEQGA